MCVLCGVVAFVCLTTHHLRLPLYVACLQAEWGVAYRGGGGNVGTASYVCATCCCIFKDVVDMLPQSTKVAARQR